MPSTFWTLAGPQQLHKPLKILPASFSVYLCTPAPNSSRPSFMSIAPWLLLPKRQCGLMVETHQIHLWWSGVLVLTLAQTGAGATASPPWGVVPSPVRRTRPPSHSSSRGWLWIWSRASKLWPVGQIWPTTHLCTSHNPSKGFTSLNGWKQSKEK